MSPSRPGLAIRRVLVALDASADSEAALTLAADLAALLGAEVQGLFVEDVNLLRVAQLPFVRQVSFPLAEVEHLDVAQMQRYWRAQALEAQRALASIAAQKGLNWSFAVREGAVTEQLLAAAQEADLLALGRYGRSLVARRPIGSTARGAGLLGQKPVLLMRAATNLDLPVLVLFAEDEGSRLALQLAALLAEQSGHLRVLIWTGDNGQARDLKREAIALIEERELVISFRRSYPARHEELVGLINRSESGLVVMSAGAPLLSPEMLATWLDELALSLLLIR